MLVVGDQIKDMLVVGVQIKIMQLKYTIKRIVSMTEQRRYKLKYKFYLFYNKVVKQTFPPTCRCDSNRVKEKETTFNPCLMDILVPSPRVSSNSLSSPRPLLKMCIQKYLKVFLRRKKIKINSENY